MRLNKNYQISLTVTNFVLLAFLLLTIFFVMVLPSSIQRLMYQLCFSGIIITSFFCIDKKYRQYIRWFILASVLLIWAYFLTGNFYLNSISKSVTIILYSVIVVLLVKQAASSKTVTRIVILESVNGYLMIGLFFSLIVALVMLYNPEAFHFQSKIKESDLIVTNFNEYLFYGFNSFATVTYGDVMPVSPVAKSVSMAMSFTGQMYVAIIIALLVGKYAGNIKEE